jgi:hypothetical protein
MFSGHSWLTSYTAKLRKRSGSCHQCGRRRRDCSSLDWCSETQKAALPHPALVDLVFYFGIDPELLTPDKSGSLKLQKVTALTEQANSRLALTASLTRRWSQKLVRSFPLCQCDPGIRFGKLRRICEMALCPDD